MQPSPAANGLRLHELARRCREESDLFFRKQGSDPRFCFELFRRACVERDGPAWECLYAQYRALALGWVARHPLAAALDEEPEYFANRAFEKLWSALTPEKFAAFDDLKALLRYLQLCVHSVIVDAARARELAEQLAEEDAQPGDDAVRPLRQPAAPGPEGGLEGALARRQSAAALWQAVEQRLKSEAERALLYGMFVDGLKPRELAQQHPRLFPGVDAVYTLKENLLARLRRDRELMQALAQALADPPESAGKTAALPFNPVERKRP